MPEEMSDDIDALRPWVEEAHQLAMREPPKKKAKKRAKKKPVAKRRGGRGS
jgi:hypothetical protein